MGVPVHVNIEEVRKPEVDAQLIADSIAQQLERRIMFRRAMKRAMQNAMRLGAQGIKIMSAGRLRTVPRSPVPSGTARAVCRCTPCAPTSIMVSPRRRRPTGSSGSRVWVLKGDILARNEQPAAGDADTENRRGRRAKPARRQRSSGKRPARRAGGEQGDADKSGKRVKAGANDAAAVEKEVS